jgi:monofunctional biosynthetic peptidoglycan transglycosylase
MLLLVIVAVLAVRVARVDIASVAEHPPRETALMRERAIEAQRRGRPVRRDWRWVPYERIAPSLRRAVLIAEDDAFYAHGGLDWNEIGASARRNLGARRIIRGGSTITQQLAKNLWAGSARTPWRKLEETLLALRLEHTLEKRRILELYLNCIEWGDGIYGAEAAARQWYGVRAEQLTTAQAIALAAVIIHPRRYSPTRPDARMRARIRMIEQRMARRGWVSAPRPAPPAAEPALPAPPGSARDTAGSAVDSALLSLPTPP